MDRASQRRVRQRGYALFDALVSIAIFGLGITGLAALQANLLAQNTQSAFRVQAAGLANALVGVALADTSNLKCYAGVAGCTSTVASAALASWRDEVSAALPGADEVPPQLDLAADGTFTVRLFWKLPREDTTHNYILVTQAPPGG